MCHFRPKVASLLASGSPNMTPDFNSKLRERGGTKLVWLTRLFHGPPLKGGMGALKKVPPPEHFRSICRISVVENLFQSAAAPEQCPIHSRNQFEKRDMKFKNSHMNNHCKRMCRKTHYDTKREFAPPRWGHMFWWALTAYVKVPLGDMTSLQARRNRCPKSEWTRTLIFVKLYRIGVTWFSYY